jgi:phasin family protein
MAARKSATTTARTPARASVAQTVAEAPVDDRAAETTVEVSAVEDVVGVSPAVETLRQTVSEKPIGVSGIMNELTKTQAEVSTHMDKTIKSAEDFVAFGQGNVEAVLKSSQILATGLQDLGKHFAATAQAQIDETVANVKALSAVKSLKEAVDLQTSLAKAAIEKALAETGKITDVSLKLAEQVSAPLTARMTVAVEKFGRTAA